MLLDAAQQLATPQGYSIGIALLLAVWAYVGIVLNLGPGLWWQEALVAGFVTGPWCRLVAGDLPLWEVTFGPDRHDGVSAIRYWAYNTSCSCMRYTSGSVHAS